MYGDRGSGGREAKGHDRRTARFKYTNTLNPFDTKVAVATALAYSPPAPALPARRGDGVVDTGAVLISRQLQRDQQRMLQRAMDGGVEAVVVFTQDFERVAEVQALVKQYPSFLYAAYGLHPDSIRGNVKTGDKRVPELRALAVTPECVALFCGLDFSRDMASHFPQEASLREQLQMAAEVRLPVLFQQVGAAERLAELVAEFNDAWVAGAAARERDAAAVAAAAAAAAADASGGGSSGGAQKGGAAGGGGKKGGSGGGAAVGSAAAAAQLPPWVPRHAVFGFDGDAKELAGFLDAGCSVILTGLVCDDASDAALRVRALLPRVPLGRLLLASNSPSHTPQSIADHFVKTSRNEPENIRYLLPAIADAWNCGLPADAPSYPVWLAAGGGGGGGAGTAATAPGDGGAAAARPRLTPADVASITYANSAAFFGLAGDDGGGVPGAGKPAARAGSGAGAEQQQSQQSEDAAAVDADDGDGDVEGGGAPASGIPAALAADAAAGAAAQQQVAPGDIHYLCRVCRNRLFTGADVLPHDSAGVRPSYASTHHHGHHAGGDGAGPSVPRVLATAAGDVEGDEQEQEEEEEGKQGGQGAADGAAGGGRGAGSSGGRGAGVCGVAKRPGGAATGDAAAGAGAVGGGKDKGAAAKDKDEAGKDKGGGRSKGGGGKGKGKRRGGDDSDDDEVFGAPPPAPPAGAGGRGGRGRRKGARGGGGGDDGSAGDEAPAPAPSAAAAPAPGGGGELHVSRWHEAKGRVVRHRDGGACRMLLVDRQPWMAAAAGGGGETEGALACPSCDAKVGDFSLSGLKCVCGLLVAPAFKVPRQRVDEVITGVDALEAALAAADLADAGGGGGGGGGGSGGESDGDDGRRKARVSKTKALAVPVHNYRGNFNLFRNQTTLKVSVGMKNKAAKKAGDEGGEGGEEATS